MRMGKFKEIVKKKDTKRTDSPEVGTEEPSSPVPDREPDSAYFPLMYVLMIVRYLLRALSNRGRL
jgi:hypothetical protein